MKAISFFSFLLVFLTGVACASLGTQRVVLPDDLIYQDRLLLIFTPRQDLPIYQRQEEVLVENVEGLAARDVQVYRLFPRSGLNPENKRINSAQVLNLRREYGVAEDQFMHVLLGKDGEAKLRKEGFLSTEDLFNFIDTLYVE
jgi:hypothetical protein